MIIRPFHRDRLPDDLARHLANACEPGSLALDVRLWIGHDETALVVTRYDGSEPSRVLAIVDEDKRRVTCPTAQPDISVAPMVDVR